MKTMKTMLVMAAVVGCCGMTRAVTLTGANAEIVVATNAAPVIKYAAEELKSALDKVLGAAVPIVNAPSAGKVALRLGDEKLSVRDEFHVKVDGQGVTITGENDPKANPETAMKQFLWSNNYQRATLFGVYEFLERFAGCRFYFEGELGTIYPKAAQLELAECDYRVKPAWTTRRYYPAHVRDWKQAYRHRMDTFFYPHCHGNVWREYVQRFAKTHPEYFLLKEDGTRRTELKIPYPCQFCHTSDIWNEIYLDAKCYLTGGKPQDRGISYKDWHCEMQSKDGIGYVDVMNQDEMKRCACEKCKAVYDDQKDFASTIIWQRTAEVAQRLIDEGIPGYIMQMAYSPYREVPKVAIPTNVLVMVAGGGPWAVNSQSTFDNDINTYRDWVQKLGYKVRSWSYPLKFWHTNIPNIPCPAPRSWAKYYQAAAPYIEGAYAESWVDRPLYNHLNYYVFSRIAWDPSVDVDAILDEYFKLMYGPAAPEMKEFFDSLEQKWVYEVVLPRSSLGCGGPGFKAATPEMIWKTIYSEAVIKHYEELFAAAEQKVGADSLEAKRLALMKKEFLKPLAKVGRLYRGRAEGLKKLVYHPVKGERIELVPFQYATVKETETPVKTQAVLRKKDGKLIIRIECEEPCIDDIKPCNLADRDDGQLWNVDRLEIFIDPNGSLDAVRHFGVASTGAWCDMISYFKSHNLQAEGDKWNSGATVKVTRGVTRWMAELAIPLEDLPGLNECCRAEIIRSRQLKDGTNELYRWSPWCAKFLNPYDYGRWDLR